MAGAVPINASAAKVAMNFITYDPKKGALRPLPRSPEPEMKQYGNISFRSKKAVLMLKGGFDRDWRVGGCHLGGDKCELFYYFWT